jgi:hypothetical protein
VFLLGKLECFSSSDVATTVTCRLAWFIFATMPNLLDFIAESLIMLVLEKWFLLCKWKLKPEAIRVSSGFLLLSFSLRSSA